MKQKILSIVCILGGLAFLSLPLFFYLYGEMKNRMLLEQIKQPVWEETVQEEDVCSDKTKKVTYQEGGVIGMIEIEALDLKYPIVEGAGDSELSVGIGHIPDTAGIGEHGNCVLAGHRGSRYGIYFKYLNRINTGDEIRLTDKEGNVYLYEAADMKVVGPYDNSVKDQGEEKVLTLLTCESNGSMRLVVTCIQKNCLYFGPANKRMNILWHTPQYFR